MKHHMFASTFYLCLLQLSQTEPRLCRVLKFSDRIYNYHLYVVPLHRYSVKYEAECALKCHSERRCKAFNLDAKESGKYECEILDTNRFRSPRNFSRNPGFIYREVKVSVYVSV